MGGWHENRDGVRDKAAKLGQIRSLLLGGKTTVHYLVRQATGYRLQGSCGTREMPPFLSRLSVRITCVKKEKTSELKRLID